MIQTNESVYILTQEELADIIRKAASAAAREAVKKIGAGDDDDLWDAGQVGKYLGLSAWTVKYKMPAVSGFPRSIALSDGPKAQRRWRAGDVKKFAERRQR